MIGSNGKELILQIEAREKERTGIKNLKVGYNRVFGYFIEISNSFRDKVPDDYIRKQTLTTGERFITQELKELEEKILTSSEKSLKLEARLYNDLLDILSQNISKLKKISGALALLDCLVAFATVAKERRYCRPKMVESGGQLTITDGRHPVVEAISKERFVPNDTLLDNEENRSSVITGPNMAGKSTYMRQVALIVLMAHMGCFVPAKEATIPITDRIFTRVGASDNLIFDQSTFMVEMTEVASILLHATKDSLLILDEVGRGTSTYDGLSICMGGHRISHGKNSGQDAFCHALSRIDGIGKQNRRREKLQNHGSGNERRGGVSSEDSPRRSQPQLRNRSRGAGGSSERNHGARERHS